MKRRRFLKLSLGGSIALSSAAVAHRLLFDYEEPRQGPGRAPAAASQPASGNTTAGAESAAAVTGCLTRRERVILRAAALRILAGAQPDPQSDEAVANSSLAFIDRYLAGMDEGLRGDVKALLSLLELYPVLNPAVGGRFTRFSRLPGAAQDRVLRSWEQSGTALLRQGMQALKAICVLAHYQDERSFASIGYSGPLVPPQGLGRVLPAL